VSVPARLQEVAIRAGVSIKTVSNVVNGYAHVSPATRARVEEAVAALDYRPNLSARSLRGGRSGIIALAVPELAVPYFAELSQSVVRAAGLRGFTVLVDQTEGLPDRERLVLEGIRPHLIDGVIFSPLALGQDELARRQDRTPMVLLGERVEAGSMDHVAIDNVAAAREAVLHLAALGRTRIAALGAIRSAKGENARLRLAGYREGLEAAGLPFRSELVAEVRDFHRHDGAAGMARLMALEPPPDAVFAFSDLLALGALRACYDRDLRVPEDIAVVGFDDIEDGRYSAPSLTTVSPDKEHIARLAMDLLGTRLEERTAKGSGALEGTPAGGGSGGLGSAGPRDVLAPHRLIVRESTAGRGKR
jgi:DNA-binding LacI/PurR family transcriptional regulator